MRERIHPTLPGWPGTKHWIALGPKIELKITGLKKRGKGQCRFLIFCFSYRLVPCPFVIRKASSHSRWEQMQRTRARHYVERKFKLEVSIKGISSQTSGHYSEVGRQKAYKTHIGMENTRKTQPS